MMGKLNAAVGGPQQGLAECAAADPEGEGSKEEIEKGQYIYSMRCENHKIHSERQWLSCTGNIQEGLARLVELDVEEKSKKEQLGCSCDASEQRDDRGSRKEGVIAWSEALQLVVRARNKESRDMRHYYEQTVHKRHHYQRGRTQRSYVSVNHRLACQPRCFDKKLVAMPPHHRMLCHADFAIEEDWNRHVKECHGGICAYRQNLFYHQTQFAAVGVVPPSIWRHAVES